ncbi:MAG: hypothetical protein ACRED3_21540, partial [Bradyrhizobium sp.]
RADAAGEDQRAKGFDLARIQAAHGPNITFCYASAGEIGFDVAMPLHRTLSLGLHDRRGT